MNNLATVPEIERRLQDLSSLADVRDFDAWLQGLGQVAAKQRAAIPEQNQITLYRLVAQRRGGEFLKAIPRAQGQSGKGLAPVLEEVGISEAESGRWQSLVRKSESDLRQMIIEASEQVTMPAAYAWANGTHVSHNSGDNEWYTPAEYIAAARQAMGGIDLDPASTKDANGVVKAARFYTAEQDGLTHPWPGRVWLNPPYATEWITAFAEKLVSEYRAKRMTAATVLVNNATETEWFQHIANHARAVCFPHGRVKFWHPEKESAAPLQGQAVLYLGKNASRFTEAFAKLGRVWLSA